MSFSSTGMIGDWKNHFTVAMNEEFDAVFKKEMKDSNIQVQFDIDKLSGYIMLKKICQFLVYYIFVGLLICRKIARIDNLSLSNSNLRILSTAFNMLANCQAYKKTKILH